MKEHKPFTEHWWWQILLDHVYYCKWKYRDLEEMKRDSVLTDFIINRIKIATLRELKEKVTGLKCENDVRYNLGVTEAKKLIDECEKSVYVD